MPREMGFGYMGMSYQEQKARQGVPPLVIFGFSLLFVFLVLAALYESWSMPFSVLLTTPVAVFGAIAALWLRRVLLAAFLPAYMVQIENDVYTQIGLVMLIGLGAKNSILIVAFAKEEYERGRSLADAALEAARLRLRPLLMTSFAFILGCVPLWTASGAGAIARQVIGTTVIGAWWRRRSSAGFSFPPFSSWSRSCRARNRPLAVSTLCLHRPKETDMRAFCYTAISTAAALLSACTVGPNYRRPVVQTPMAFHGPTESRQTVQTESFADLPWWQVFHDPQLQELIGTALKQNYDLQLAVERVNAARAQVGIVRFRFSSRRFRSTLISAAARPNRT
jgi:AcrB/AcrD/AcrF family protein